MIQSFGPITGSSCSVLSELEKGKMSHSSIWEQEETRLLIKIWSKNVIKRHQKKSQKHLTRSFGEGKEQYYLKIKKLWLQYTKLCNVTNKSSMSITLYYV